MRKCTECLQEKELAKFEKNRKKCTKCRGEYRKRLYTRRGEGLRYFNLKKKYGLSREQYLGLSEKQEHKCAICGKTNEFGPWPGKTLVVDHCHKTGQIRGLLCDKCNKGLGQFDDSTIFLSKAIEYLST